MMPIYGLNQGIQPIIGYNYGAVQIKRVKETLRTGIIIATSICTFGFLCIMFFSYNILSIFTTNDTKLIEMGSHALKMVLLFLPLNGFQIVSWAYFQAVGKPKQAIILTLTKQVILFFPLMLILPHFFQLEGIWMTPPIADLIAAILVIILLIIELKRLRGIEAGNISVSPI
jgi:Na+-driven multidrug efflux pump